MKIDRNALNNLSHDAELAVMARTRRARLKSKSSVSLYLKALKMTFGLGSRC